MLTSKEVAEKTEVYAADRSLVIRNEVLRHIMEEAVAPMSRTFRGEKRGFQAFRQVITVTMNQLAGWRAVGVKDSPRWVTER